MRLHRFYLQNENFETLKTGDSFICKEEAIVRQIGLILRAKAGDRVRFFNNNAEWEFEILSISKKELICNAKESISLRIPKKRLILVQSLVKKDKFEWIAQKATELGVAEIIPVTTERSEKRGLDEKRLQKIMIEATEQSGWGRIPKIHKVLNLEDSLKMLKKENIPTYILDMGGEVVPKTSKSDVVLYVGPEGGWGDIDKKSFKEYKLKKISLGESVLRAETAAIVGIYSLNN